MKTKHGLVPSLSVVVAIVYLSGCNPINDPTLVVQATPRVGFSPLAVQFAATSDVVLDSEATYLWDFGDGSTSTEATPNHVYETPKTYTVRVSLLTEGRSVSREFPNLIDVRNPKVRRVRPSTEADNPDGATWQTAYSSIQEAIDEVEKIGGGEIWLSVGEYRSQRTRATGTGAIEARKQISLLGGFYGDDLHAKDRTLDASQTIVDGSIARGGNAAFHVIRSTESLFAECLTITGGYADVDTDGIEGRIGGGIYVESGILDAVNLIVRNNVARTGGGVRLEPGTVATFSSCLFTENFGSAIQASGAEISITACDFRTNFSRVGGALSLGRDGDIIISSSYFEGNEAIVGGAVYTYSTTTVINSIFWNNMSYDLEGGSKGGGIFWEGGTLFLMNNTFFGNIADQGGAIQVERFPIDLAGSVNIVNCAFGDNLPSSIDGDDLDDTLEIRYSLLERLLSGEGNIVGSPEFMNPDFGDFTPMLRSPLVDAGDSREAPNRDFVGTLRPQGDGIDIGAIERE